VATQTSEPFHPRFHFIGGKGGVGKTTCAAAIAAAAARAGTRVLVASADPAPSLGEALNVSLTGAARAVPGAGDRLRAVEIDASVALTRWIEERRAVLATIALQGTWLDRDDVERLLRLSLPGIDELAALLEIDRLAHARRYDLVVVDTAPTGHTLRMLAMPETLMAVSRVFDRMREKQRVVQDALGGGWSDGPEDRLIDELAHTSQRLHGLLRDASRTRLDWVTLAEPLAVAETTDAVESLNAAGIPVRTIIINRLTPPPPSRCGHCHARRTFEAISVRSLRALGPVVHVQARVAEPRGIRALGAIAAEIQREAPALPSAPAHAKPWRARVAGRPVPPWQLLAPGTRLVLLGGKGGVGKSTCAAAVALSACQRWPDRRILLISTDPAHSLSDVFAQQLDDRPSLVRGAPPNLRVRELDAGKVLALLQQEYATAIDRMFDRLRGQSAFDATHDRAVMRTLIDLAPPGLDELAAVLETTDALAGDPSEWDLIIMDTAPTGHALRLLEMPALIHDWTHALMSILLKYQEVTPLGELGAMLVRLSKGIRELRGLLADPQQTVFIAVTRAAALPRLETGRLVARLAEMGIHVPAVVANAVGRGTCANCRKSAAAEERELAVLRRLVERRPLCRLVIAPALVPAPRGATDTASWGRTWRGVAAQRTRTRAISSTR
jgi:arsenite/tail-anchored protein-transporting ATPase